MSMADLLLLFNGTNHLSAPPNAVQELKLRAIPIRMQFLAIDTIKMGK